MKKYLLHIVIFLTLTFFLELKAQNFFPLSVGNKYEFIDHYFCPSTYTEWTKYLATEIQDSLIYNAEIFYKYTDPKKEYYFNYDSLGQKLFIYDNFFHKKLAADFNLSQGEQFISYISGTGLIYTSLGESIINIWGQDRVVWSMKYVNPTNNNREVYTFVDGIGFYKDLLSGSEFYDDLHYLSAIINSQKFNPFDFTINLLTDLNDRYIDEFPFYVNISLNAQFPELIDSLYIYYQLIRGGCIIFDHKSNFNRTYYQAIVNLNPSILEVGDTVKIKIVATDSSIFHNYVTLPESGFYSIRVLGDTTTSVKNSNKNIYLFSLEQNYPNPVNPTTNIHYTLANSEYVTLKVYDILGKDIVTLVSGEMPAGSYSIQFDGSNLSSGIYFYQLKAGLKTATKKLIILR